MIALGDIREELKEIRYYMSRKAVFDKSAICVGKNTIEDRIKIYNRYICNATPRLYDIYVSLYLENNTQESLAQKLGISLEYMSRLNGMLVKFFQQKFIEYENIWWGEIWKQYEIVMVN